MSRKEKKEKEIINDEPYTNMNVEGFRWYTKPAKKKKDKEIKDLKLSKREHRAIIKAALRSYLPFALIFIGGFGVVFLLIYLWFILVT